MTRATVAALLAGVLAAAALVELAAARRSPRRPRPRRSAVLLALLARLGRRAGLATARGDIAERLVAAGTVATPNGPMSLTENVMMVVMAVWMVIGTTH